MAKGNFSSYDLVVLQSRAQRSLRNFLQQQLDAYNLTVMEWALLDLIGQHQKKGGVGVSELARQLGVKTALTSVMVKKQTNAGFVEKQTSSNDSRLRLVRLTSAGQKHVDTIHKALSTSEKAWLPDIASKDKQKYFEVLELMAGTV